MRVILMKSAFGPHHNAALAHCPGRSRDMEAHKHLGAAIRASKAAVAASANATAHAGFQEGARAARKAIKGGESHLAAAHMERAFESIT